MDEKLKLNEVDVLYSTTFDNEPGYIYLLIEHQSSFDKFMPLRMLKYITKIIDQHLLHHQDGSLPLVYPMVFYHGQSTYNASTDILELFAQPELARTIFLRPFNLIDVTQIPDENLKQSVLSGTFMFILKHIFDSYLFDQ